MLTILMYVNNLIPKTMINFKLIDKAKTWVKYNYSDAYIQSQLYCCGMYSLKDIREAIQIARDELVIPEIESEINKVF